MPLPRLGIVDRNCADMHVAVIDQPTFLAGFRTAAAGESGHAPLKRGFRGQAIALQVGLETDSSPADRGC